ncbi:hypothetical protein B0T22DRAFT_440232 [Podospora appendiculata]|uniref:Uncharacterized protein n=1 Tax=Podospora appendiculata TaxID=314037 RepID=A0AAE0XA51_9PEZI|nr:hypothetical protein B0T22DRAFT_440232 [Podospora appendiculata]
MNRLAQRALTTFTFPLHAKPPLQFRTYATTTTSAPKGSEQASAQSGGSRSKDYTEAHHANNNDSDSPAPTEGVIRDSLSEGGAKGRTGGGKPLHSSRDPPPRPTVRNASVAADKKLSAEQQAEVDAHNADFEKKHDKAQAAADDKVHKSFWSGQGSREGRKEGGGGE